MHNTVADPEKNCEGFTSMIGLKCLS